MPGPVQPASSIIGTLLRQIVEDKSKAPHTQVPTADPSTPQRNVVQAPLEEAIAPESPGTERVINLPPESAVTPSADAAAPVTPGTSKIGPIGGPGVDPNAFGNLPAIGGPSDRLGEAGNVVAANAPPPPPAPISTRSALAAPAPQPTLQDYLNKGKTAAQWYAETGRQSTLDAIDKDPNQKIDLNTGQASIVGGPRSGEAKVNPNTGQIYFQPEPDMGPNTATLQDYLNQGKTAQQWFAETGRQNELDQLTAGSTQELSPTALQPYLPKEVQGPPGPNGQVAGASTGLARYPSTSPELGYQPPLQIGEYKGLLPTPISRSDLRDAGVPLSTYLAPQLLSDNPDAQATRDTIAQLDMLGAILAKPAQQRTPEEQKFVDLNTARRLGDKFAQSKALKAGVPTPTPRPLIY